MLVAHPPCGLHRCKGYAREMWIVKAEKYGVLGQFES